MKKQSVFSFLRIAFMALTVILPGSALAQSSINWLTAIQYAKLVNIAEGVSPSSDYTSADKQLISEQGYTFLQPIYGSDLSTDATPDVSDTVSYGYLALSPAGELVAVLRGTDTILEWIDDAQFYFVFNPIPNTYGFTEEGFSGIYRSLRIARSTSSQTAVSSMQGYVSAGTAKSVTIAGHSLGGALATLLALDVARNSKQKSPVIYTYASPRVGEEFFANDFNDTVPTSYRIYNNTDVVPDFPLWPYTSVKTPFELVSNSSQVNTDITCSHHLTTYLWLMGQKAGVNAGTLEANCIPGN
jgi:predicted lipase